LIGKISFTDHFWLLLAGAMPTAARRRILDATLVASAEHGLVPSVQVSHGHAVLHGELRLPVEAGGRYDAAAPAPACIRT
jgi:hypothetical protein